MSILPDKQPTNRRDPMPTKPQRGDAEPRMSVLDHNRGYFVPLQGTNKVWQNPEEIFNQPTKSNHGAIYDSGTDTAGVPNQHDPIIRRGPFNVGY